MKLVRCSGNSHVRLNIETKLRPIQKELFLAPKDFTHALLKVVRDQGFLDRVTIQSFDWRTLQETQRQAPGVRTSYLTIQQKKIANIARGKPGPSSWTAGFDVDDFGGSVVKMIAAAGGKVWSPLHHKVSAESIQQAHDLGLEIKVWTVNDAARMEALIKMGVDGIITDYPDRLRLVLETLNRPVPMPTPVPASCLSS